METLATVAEVRELRAETEGVLCEGRVIESHVERGRGNVATVLVTRGPLKPGDHIVAGVARCKVRQLTTPSGQALKVALPGQPIEIMGWKDLPSAGDEVLEARDEAEAVKVVKARTRRAEQNQILRDVEAINEKTRIETEARNQVARRKAALSQALRNGTYVSKEEYAALTAAEAEADNVVERRAKSVGVRELLLIVKADFHGTLEAVTDALNSIGNSDVRAKVVNSGVGDVTEGDVEMAQAVKGTLSSPTSDCKTDRGPSI